jgi:voltage-gated potassium channel Kch
MTGDKETGGTGADELQRGPPKLALRLMSQDVTARRAVRMIATATTAFAVLGGVLMWAFDKQDFTSIGQGLWFSLQTVTTVGYGDVVPHNTEGRIIAGLVMLAGIGFIAVITAAVTAALVESARRRPRQESTARVERRLDEIDARLEAIQAALRRKE